MFLTFDFHSPSSNGIGFVHGKCKEDNFHECILYWYRGTHYSIGEKKFASIKEMREFACDQLSIMHDPFKAAIQRVNRSIDVGVKEASHKMDLRIAKFRGYLFSQKITLRYGSGYVDSIIDGMIAELESDRVVGREVEHAS